MTLPCEVTTIGENAFTGCNKIENMVIPSKVTNIGKSAFSQCYGMLELEFKGNAPSVGENAFDGMTNCVAYVRKDSTGWNVYIPGKWKGLAIDYSRYDVTFAANDRKTF